MFLAFTNNGPGGRDRPSYYERGIACALDNAIDAHMWFNLAAMDGDERGAPARAGVALDMTAREIAEAQRRARTFFKELRQAA